MIEKFRERLDELLAGRKLYPWSKKIGLTSGATDYMSKGNVPGAEILNTISRNEQVSLSWLATGNGSPYLVNYTSTDEDLLYQLQVHIGDESGRWNLAILSDGEMVVYALHMPGQWQHKDKPFDYTILEIIVGKSGEDSRKFLAENIKNLREICFVPLESDEMKELRSGKWGTYKLIGDEKTPGVIFQKGHIIDNPIEVIPETAYEKDSISYDLMTAVIKMINDVSDELGIEISKEQYGKLVTSVYRYAQRTNATANALDKNAVIAILETL